MILQTFYIFGDFNMVPSSDLDRLHFSVRHSATYRTLSRIDLVFNSVSALNWARDACRLSREISDHAPICLMVSLVETGGLRLWRLSRYWALDAAIQEGMEESICNYWTLNQELASSGVRWDYGLMLGVSTSPGFPCHRR